MVKDLTPEEIGKLGLSLKVKRKRAPLFPHKQQIESLASGGVIYGRKRDGRFATKKSRYPGPKGDLLITRTHN